MSSMPPNSTIPDAAHELTPSQEVRRAKIALLEAWPPAASGGVDWVGMVTNSPLVSAGAATLFGVLFAKSKLIRKVSVLAIPLLLKRFL